MEPHPASTSEFHTPFEFQIDERQNEISSDPSADTISRILRFRKSLQATEQIGPTEAFAQVEKDHAHDTWKQIQQLSNLSVDSEHLQELMDELHNEPLPESDSNPIPCAFNAAAPLDTPTTGLCTAVETALNPSSHVEQLASEEPLNPPMHKKNILDLCVEELRNLKEFISTHQDGTITLLLETKSIINTRDPIFIFLAYQSAGNILLLIDHLMASFPSSCSWWTPSFDLELIRQNLDAIPSSILHGDSPSYLSSRMHWLANKL
ncbi:hypothetical protein DI09_2p390 [Mitosporidium daphniae]|uniref:Uncharacterized protein n=1 Tax=Mitosporidium daphniae TaxID=1485682 RepID=A0A098VRK6_9MICR|nr:uncharacterized protein DI09_2p390 [Mitosporidium daphniae]KGG51662.1 hypothetical protein DI09_2p390 [Mitosporidium daphniae]|eukprot:XP_013238089.1 uncharacterized protein DI09_2p390 [Mitosporidium daphniae]